MSTRIIGIDFGTSTTVVRVHNVGAGNPVFPLEINGQTKVPTIAFKDAETGMLSYGYDALVKINSNKSGELIRNFKMLLISSNEDDMQKARELINGFMAYLYSYYQKNVANQKFPEADEIKVYISHPAKWPSAARSLMKQSVVVAGFCPESQVSLKDEPTAAVLAALHEDEKELRTLGMLHAKQKHKAMMVDMGAGTTDIVLFNYSIQNEKLFVDDIFTYPSVGHPGLCGGREIDEALSKAAEAYIKGMTATTNKIAENTIKKINHRIKAWKENTVSPTLTRNDVLPEPDAISDYRDTLHEFGTPVLNEGTPFSISREYFEKETKTHWMQWRDLLENCFKEASLSQFSNLNIPKRPEDVELLIITGGHSQWYIVQDFLLGKTNKGYLRPVNFSKIVARPSLLLTSNDPQETVALGLCYLDEDIVDIPSTANDVDIAFRCEGQMLGGADLVKKGQELPYVKNDIKLKGTIKGNFVYQKQLILECFVRTDKTNEIKKDIIIPADGIIAVLFQGAITAVLGVIGGAFKLLSGEGISKKDVEELVSADYKVDIKPTVNVTEEGIITIAGKALINGKSVDIPKIVI